jgi:outer membrane protein OmpA-like peptidoglycan-associated protein
MPTTPRFPCAVLSLCLSLLAWSPPSLGAAKSKRGTATAGSPLEISVDRSKVDLKAHRLEIKLSRKPSKVSIRVEAESGAVLADEEQDFSDRPAPSPLVVTWTPSSDEPVEKIEVRATDALGSYTVTLTPYNFTIEHEDVNFKTGSAVIEESETPKLETAHGKIIAKVAAIRAKDINHQHRNLTLFIAGHTDTVGGFDYNIGLSRERASAIANWFRRRGVPLPVAYEGFGESSPRVATADQVDEPRNRRVDYIIADDPASASSILKTTGFKPAWKRAN